MRHFIMLLAIATLGAQFGCAGCVGFGEEPDDRMDPNSNPPYGLDVGDGDSGGVLEDLGGAGGDVGDGRNNNSPDTGTSADMGAPDVGDIEDMGGVDLGPADVCGDGMRTGTEVCDDGNTDDGDYCSAGCDAETGFCGDGVQQGNEACDDGNTANGDYCDGLCLTVTGSCGDGALQGGENCDDGVTTMCAGTHDGGDGSCVPLGTCASGYVLSGNSCVPNSTGLSVPCSNGSGFTMFRYHYSNNSSSAQIDVWDASCSYSFAPNSACNVYEICPGFCDPPTTSEGYPIFNSSNYMRVRFNANGLSFSQATLYIQARSYATSSSADVEVWSPLYGGYVAGPIDNDFVYDWYALDWTGYLYPSDQPSLTAIQLYGARGSVAIKAVELCVE